MLPNRRALPHQACGPQLHFAIPDMKSYCREPCGFVDDAPASSKHSGKPTGHCSPSTPALEYSIPSMPSRLLSAPLVPGQDPPLSSRIPFGVRFPAATPSGDAGMSGADHPGRRRDCQPATARTIRDRSAPAQHQTTAEAPARSFQTDHDASATIAPPSPQDGRSDAPHPPSRQSAAR
jgi:hypothetical protein